MAGAVVFGQIGPAQDNDDLDIVLNVDGSWTVSGIWETTDPANVSIANFADALSSAVAGSDVALYFNIYTGPFPAGEIRGQLVAGGDQETGTDRGDTITAPAGEAVAAFGRGGNDSLTGGDLPDLLDGGAGNDTVSGGGGNDILRGASADTINTGAGDDHVSGGGGDDSIGGMAGSDTVLGGGGNDVIAWNDPTGDLVFGGSGRDTIIGGNVAADTIFGGDGDDLIRAFATDASAATAPDALSGGGGRDLIQGGDANDTIEGGAGADTLTGNRGADSFVVRADEATGQDVVTDFERGADVVRLVGFAPGFDPLANLVTVAAGAALDLGDGNQVIFAGRLVGDFAADDFVIA
jgi:serralysin